MPKLRLSGDDVIPILRRFGFAITSQRGSHVKLVGLHAPAWQILTVPLHADLDTGTLHAIYRQASRYIPEN